MSYPQNIEISFNQAALRLRMMQQQQKQKKTGFSIEYTIQCLEKINQVIKENGEVPFEQFCQVLDQFCFVFKELNSFLGIAFSDVKDKVGHIKANNIKFPGHPGFLSFIKMQMQKKIHIINGKDNAKKKVPQQYATYSSTARSLLRMMWLLTFIKVTFSRCKEYPNQSLSTTFGVAYDEAFGKNHGWVIRNSAKLAMMASQSRQKLVEIILKAPYNQTIFQETNKRFLEVLVPVHDYLWKFYTDNKIQKLD